MVSILIISYGRNNEVLDTFRCISKYQGDKIELLFLDNNQSSILKDKLSKIILGNKDIEFKYFHAGINYGVAKGRNYLIERATGEYLITLDDDVEIEDINDLISKVKNYFNKKCADVLAFNIKNFYTRERLSKEIPHGNKKLDFSSNLETYYFIGAGHAIKKCVYDNVGLYPNDLGMYGGEERDLSFRILNRGYRILYTSDIVVYHKVSPQGRMLRAEEEYYRYRNQLIVLNRYMPFIYRVSSNIMWSAFYFFKKRGSIRNIFCVLKDVFVLKKKAVHKTVLRKIKESKGRVWY